MAATVHLNYDSGNGHATATLSGSTLTVTARPFSRKKLTLISVTCDQGNDKSQSYDTTSQATLVSTGHTSCHDINVTVVFAIIPGTSYVDVYTAVGTGQGTTSPGYSRISFTAGRQSEVVVQISATPAAGYKFVRWVNGGDVEVSTNATTNMHIDVSHIPAGTTVERRYYAQFALQDYPYTLWAEYHVTDDPVTGRRSRNIHTDATYSAAMWGGNYRYADLYYKGTLYNRDGTQAFSGRNVFARLIGRPDRYTTADNSIRVELSITNQALWDLLGLGVLGWRIREINPTGQQWEQPDSGGVTFTATHVPQQSDWPGYRVDVILCTDDVHKLEFECKPDGAAELYIYGKSYSAGDPSVRGVGTQTTYAAAGDLLSLEVMSVLLPGSGVVHGWSESLPDSTVYAGSPVASKDLTMPGADKKVTVYVCDHRLLHGASGNLLHGAQNSLLYNCNVPPGTTVYD